MTNGKRFGGEWVLPSERAKLVRLCTLLVGQSEVAEDLVQETLVEAWRNRHRLREGVEQLAWLSGIARRVCLRWRRRVGQEQVYLRPVPMAAAARDELISTPQDVDFETVLSRAELASLLDRALALLPPHTRMLLIQQYVDEMPRSEMAARLGISEGAVAVRLHRGKLALRHIFERNLRDDVLAYDLFSSRTSIGKRQNTLLWCPLCGRDRLAGHFDPNTGSLALGCPRCSASHPYVQVQDSGLLTGAVSCRAALRSLLTWSHSFFSDAARTGVARCYNCNAAVPMRRIEASCSSAWSGSALQVSCPACRMTCTGAVSLVFCPEVLEFWQRYPRMRVSKQQTIVASGHPALLTRFQSVMDAATIELIQTKDTLEPMRVVQS